MLFSISLEASYNPPPHCIALIITLPSGAMIINAIELGGRL